VKFLASALHHNHHLLVKNSFKSACEISVLLKCNICSMLFAGNIAVEQEVLVAAIMIALLISTRF